MARYIGPVCRLCRASGQKLYLKGNRCFSDKCALERRNTKPGMHGASSSKMTEYAVQLREKQKVKNIYGLLEKQFYKYYEEADKKEGITGELLLSLLEQRLDNIIFRLGVAKSRSQARQIVRHKHVKVNGKIVNIPSFRVKEGDVISVSEKSKDITIIKEAVETAKVPSWLDFNAEKLEGKLVQLPKRDAIDYEINEQLIVEFYSR
ncbi:30S ribosomal protein S4 [Haliovirga abyssi]|uniref:Small ribosomal subunit protein uS4 n=1 Tax=Haliovirga abyssi TaxID=2996794 RepID=A0AAU9D0R2_9FUSO|nr:30S ribosomal protein S4 [Haliovirga abyssi]BDU49549.1 30S ribosomal protein S4 [Haliovirga abyssi]